MPDTNIYELKLLSEDDNTAVYGGYGVVFNTTDLEGDTFTKDTDFMLDLVPVKPVYIDHSQPTRLEMSGKTYVIKGIDDPVGQVVEVEPDDIGLYMKLQFSKSDRYWALVDALLSSQKSGLSSGSVPHLVRRGNGFVKTWPLFEESITLTPAEPQTARMGIDKLKQLAESNPEIKALITEESGPDSDDSGDGAQSVDVNINITYDGEPVAVEPQTTVTIGEPTMTEETKEVVIETAPSIEAIKAAFGDALQPLNERLEQLERQPAKQPVKAAPPVLKTGLGDTETKAIAHWIREGDTSGLKGAANYSIRNGTVEMKASNDTIMNIAADADGGHAVPEGHFQNIIARRDESALATVLGVRRIPGIGTTVHVPVDNEADGEFISTSEQVDAGTNTFDRDAPALGNVAMTLVKYTKKVVLTDELMHDEDSRLMTFLEDFIGRGMAKTMNDLLLIEVAANGTSLKTFASATAIADGEIEDIEGGDDLGGYLDDAGSVAWVMRNTTLAAVRKISGSDRVYSVESGGGPGVRASRSLLGYPVYRSNKAAAIAASAKPIYFGNWFYVGWREEPSLTLLRDPYSTDGVLTLKYYFRTDFATLIAEAIGYAEHPSA